jgi:hypothetical protein
MYVVGSATCGWVPIAAFDVPVPDSLCTITYSLSTAAGQTGDVRV